MIPFAELLALDETLRDIPTLTLYLDGRGENPAWRTAWRRVLRHEELRLRQALADASHDEREAFSRCVEALEEQLSHRRRAIDAPGWLLVVADGKVHLDTPLRGATPTLAFWRRGVTLAPFLFTAAYGGGEAHVVVADSRAARAFHCDDAGVHRIHTVRTTVHERHGEMGRAATSGGSHHATRGGVGRDTADRERRAARSRMLREMALYVKSLSPPLPVLVGGTPQLLGEAMTALSREGVHPVIETPALGARARVNEISRAVRHGLVELRRHTEKLLVQELLRRYGNDDLASTGLTATRRALDESAVHTLVLSHAFITMHAETAEVFVRAALKQDATVEAVSGDAARMLEESGGVGVLLRFSPYVSAPEAERELVHV